MISEHDYTKSSFSAGGACVEVRLLPDGKVGVRDSKDQAKTPHFFTAQEWAAFLAGVRNGEFDLGIVRSDRYMTQGGPAAR